LLFDERMHLKKREFLFGFQYFIENASLDIRYSLGTFLLRLVRQSLKSVSDIITTFSPGTNDVKSIAWLSYLTTLHFGHFGLLV